MRLIVPIIWIYLCCSSGIADTLDKPRREFGLGDATVLAVSSDLRYVATGGQGGAYLWDAVEGSLKSSLPVEWWVTALAFSPVSNLVAVASRQRVYLFDTGTGLPTAEFVGHLGDIYRLHFSADGSRLVSSSADNTARIWSLEDKSELQKIRIPGSSIGDVSISPDGQKLATVDTFLTNCVKIWDLQAATLLRAIPKTNWTAHWCRFAPDGNLLVAGSDRSLVLWDIETAEQVRAFSGVTGSVAMIYDVWMPDHDTVGAIASDGNIYLWNYQTAALTLLLPGTNVIAAVGVPNDFLTVATSLDWTVRIRQLPGGDALRTFKGHTTSVHSGVAISPDGRYVLSGGSEQSTRLWDRQTGHPVREFIGNGSGTMTAAFSPNGSNVLTTIGLPNPAARLWNTQTGELLREFKWNGSWAMGAVFSPDGTKIAAHEQVGSVRIFDVATGALLRTLGSSAFGGKIAFSPRRSLLAVTSNQSGVALYNYETGQRLHTFSLDAGPVSAIEFSPLDETLLIGWSEGGIHLFDPVTFEFKREFPVKPAFLESVKFSPDGRHLLTGEGWPLFTATLWDVQRAAEIRTFAGHRWVVSALAFNATGTSILTGADRVREWSIADVVSDLHIELNGQPQLRWSVGALQHAASPTAPWQTLSNAVSPFIVPGDNPSGFFRVQVQDE